ncbi:hypothetical protein GCM10027268_03120 [Brachybacterium huguangmaarense]
MDAMHVPGIIHGSDLRERGIDRAQIRAWQRRGTVRAVGCWFVTDAAPPDLVALLERGVRPTCLDACALHGLWIPSDARVHVFRPRTSSRADPTAGPRAVPIRRRRDSVTGLLRAVTDDRPSALLPLVHHRPFLAAWPDRDPVPDLELALEHAGRCLPVRDLAILIESALNLGLLPRSGVDALLARLPQRTRSPLARVRSDAQSGTETAVRWWLESLRVSVRAQVPIAGVGRVDLVIGSSWVIECDSRTFHDGTERYRRDRERDLVLRALGYTVTRLTWEQVFVTWAATEASLLAVLRRGDHRRRLAA